MLHTKSCIALLAVFSFSAHTRGQTTAVFETPIHISEYNLVFAKTVIDGHEALALIDSGSFRRLQLSASLARSLDLSLTRADTVARRHQGKEVYLQSGRVEKFKIGNYEKSNVDVAVIEGDIETIAAQVGTRFDAIIGWGFLSQFCVRLDYRNRLLRWSDAPLAVKPGRLRLPYSVVNGAPVVEGMMGDQKVKLLFDTGAPMCNLDSALASDARTGDRVTQGISLGDRSFSIEFRIKDLSVIRKSLGCVGVIGNNWLADYSIYFDNEARYITLE
jgi:hypothetical protein